MLPARLHFMGHGAVTDDAWRAFAENMMITTLRRSYGSGFMTPWISLGDIQELAFGYREEYLAYEIYTSGSILPPLPYGFAVDPYLRQRLEYANLRESLPWELFIRPQQFELPVMEDLRDGNEPARRGFDRLEFFGLDEKDVASNVFDQGRDSFPIKRNTGGESEEKHTPGCPYLWAGFVNQDEWPGVSEKGGECYGRMVPLEGSGVSGTGDAVSDPLRRIELRAIELESESFLLACVKFHKVAPMLSSPCFEVDRYFAGSPVRRLLLRRQIIGL